MFVNLITVFVTWSTVRSAACVDARAALTTVTGLAALSTSSSIASAPNSRSTDVDKYTRSRAVAALAHGAPLLRPGLVSIPDDLSTGQNVLVTSIKGEAVCFVKVNTDSENIAKMEKGEIARPSAVLMNDDVYPRRW